MSIASPRAIERELRDAWVTGRRVQITTKPPERARARGTVKQVAATGTFAIIGRTHVPIDRIAQLRDAAPLLTGNDRTSTPDGATQPPWRQARLPNGNRARRSETAANSR